IEAYPIDVDGRVNDWRLWQGTLGMFRAAGFRELVRRRGQPLVRLDLTEAKGLHQPESEQ
ncbi:MAG: hypothetical protein ACRDJN_20250, partial [Chloroflexota bacterium]